MSEVTKTSEDLRQASEEQEVLLPQTAEGLEAFISEITKDYGLPESDDTREAISTMVLHLPNHRAYAPKSFFGNGVRRQIANAHAYAVCRQIGEARQAKEEEEKAKIVEQLEKARAEKAELEKQEAEQVSGQESI